MGPLDGVFSGSEGEQEKIGLAGAYKVLISLD
jgi:hypothetical protein